MPCWPRGWKFPTINSSRRPRKCVRPDHRSLFAGHKGKVFPVGGFLPGIGLKFSLSLRQQFCYSLPLSPSGLLSPRTVSLATGQDSLRHTARKGQSCKCPCAPQAKHPRGAGGGMLPTLLAVIWEAPLSLQALTARLTVTFPLSPHRGKHVTPTTYLDPAHSQSLPWHCRMNRERALLPLELHGRGSPWSTCPLLSQNGARHRQSDGGLHLNPRISVPELDLAALGASGSYSLLLVNERVLTDATLTNRVLCTWTFTHPLSLQPSPTSVHHAAPVALQPQLQRDEDLGPRQSLSAAQSIGAKPGHGAHASQGLGGV